MSLYNSDWLSISLIGFILGASVSYYFFRTHQQKNANALNKLQNGIDQILQNTEVIKNSNSILNKVLTNTEVIKDSNSIYEKNDVDNSLKNIKSSIEGLQKDIDNSINKILADVKEQQKELASSVQKDFKQQVEESSQVN